MTRILLSIGHSYFCGVVRRILTQQVNFEVVICSSEARSLYSAQHRHFDVAVLGRDHANILNLDLAHALNMYDQTLPLVLVVPAISEHDKGAIAKVPFKAVFRMPLPPGDLVLAVQGTHARL